MRRLAILFAALALVAGFAPAADAADSNPDPRIAVHTDGTSFLCNGPIDLDLLKVANVSSGDSVRIQGGCRGTINRVEVDAVRSDGIKIAAHANIGPITIQGGYVRCTAALGVDHQDALQAGGGVDVTIRNVVFDCLGNSNFYVNGWAGRVPLRVICNHCALGPNAGNNLFVGPNSSQSGARDTLVCPGRHSTYRIRPADAVNEGNITGTPAQCTWEAMLAYVGGTPSPPPPPPPDPEPEPDPDPPPFVCDQACVGDYEATIAAKDARISELESRVGELLGEVAKRDALLAQIHALSG